MKANQFIELDNINIVKDLTLPLTCSVVLCVWVLRVHLPYIKLSKP